MLNKKITILHKILLSYLGEKDYIFYKFELPFSNYENPFNKMNKLIVLIN